MRTRSGALHCDSEQELIKLSELSLNQSGLFYDEKMNRLIDDDLPKSQTVYEEHSHLFSEFDFSLEKEQHNAEIRIDQENPQESVNIVIVCNDITETCTLLEKKPIDCDKRRQIDLIVHKKDKLSGGSVIFKYWIIEVGILETPLASTYISRNCKQYWACSQPCKIDSALVLESTALEQTLTMEQQNYCTN